LRGALADESDAESRVPLRGDEPAVSEDADNGTGGRAIWKDLTLMTLSSATAVGLTRESKGVCRYCPNLAAQLLSVCNLGSIHLRSCGGHTARNDIDPDPMDQ